MFFPRFLSICLINLFCFTAPIAAMLPQPYAGGAQPPAQVVPPLPGLHNAGGLPIHNFIQPPPSPLSDEHYKKFKASGDHEFQYEDDKPMNQARKLLQAAVNYPFNFANHCAYNVYVKVYSAITGEHIADGGNLGPQKTSVIHIPNSFNDVEIFPLKNCKGPGGTQCETGGCKSHPNEHGKCSKLGEGKNSAVRFDLRNGVKEAYNVYDPLNGFDVGAIVEPHKKSCPTLSVTRGAQETLNCDHSGGYTITYCAPNTSAETNGGQGNAAKVEGNGEKKNAEMDSEDGI